MNTNEETPIKYEGEQDMVAYYNGQLTAYTKAMPVRALETNIYCHCNDKPMKQTGEIGMSNPPVYRFKCEDCGAMHWQPKPYPIVEFVPLEETHAEIKN